jgi:hypothetical protein
MSLLQPTLHPYTSRLACASLLISPPLFWVIENYVTRGYKPSYSYIANFTSDLAVPYPFHERTHNRAAHSTRAGTMKRNFQIKSVLFLIGHLSLLWATGRRDGITAARAAAALAYGAGIWLVAAVPGGEREHADSSVKWHSLGAMTAFSCGNLSAILAGRADGNETYARLATVMGSVGLCNMVLFVVFGKTRFRGFWQRSCLFTIQAWELVTGWAVLGQLL